MVNVPFGVWYFCTLPTPENSLIKLTAGMRFSEVCFLSSSGLFRVSFYVGRAYPLIAGHGKNRQHNYY